MFLNKVIYLATVFVIVVVVIPAAFLFAFGG